MKDSELALTPPYIGRLWLLTALALAALPHLFRLSPWLSFGCGVIFFWRFLHETRGTDLPPRWLRLLLVMFGIGAVLFSFHTLVGLEPGVATLTVMLCLKLMELRTIRDALIALFIGYFMVISGFLFSQSIFMGAYLFLVVLALTSALIALNHRHAAADDSRFYLSFSAKLLLQSLPLMVVMFLLFPRLSGPLWQMPDDKKQASTGLGDSMEMGSISNLVNSEAIAFRVDFDGPIPPASRLYWRGPVLWLTDGRRWQPLHRQPPAFTLPEYQAIGDSVSYTVTLEPNNRRWLFAIDLPQQLPQRLNSRSSVTPDFQLLSLNPISKKTRYSIQSATDFRLTAMPPSANPSATQLPPDANPKTLALGRQWREEGLSATDALARALALIREQPFYYTRQPPLLGSDPVDEFLFSSRRGFCEHYAAAFVTLMRAAGVPARVVTGYQGGEYNPVGDYLIVRQSNAHAWAEIWTDDRGWIRVDPTAEIPPERVETTADTSRFQSVNAVGDDRDSTFLRSTFSQLRQSWDAVNHIWNQWVLGFDRAKQRRLLQQLGLSHLSWSSLILLMVAVIAVVLALIGLKLLHSRPRHVDPVLRLYHRFCDKMRKAGIEHKPNEGPNDYLRRIIRHRPDLEPAVTEINDIYIRLRYARDPDMAQIKTLRQRLNRLRISFIKPH